MNDKARIQERNWPMYPFLPLKRYVGGQPQFSFLEAQDTLTVYHGYYMLVGQGQVKLESLDKTRYANLDALLTD